MRCKLSIVLEEKEVIMMESGKPWPAGVVPYKGTYFSDNATDRIMHARVEKVKLK